MKLHRKYILAFCILISFFTSLFMTLTPTQKEDAPAAISVYRQSSGVTETISLEDYVCGVVAAEVPSSFEAEAIKAQAVASRTYAAAKCLQAEVSGNPSAHPDAPICDTTHCQVYLDKFDLLKKKGRSWMDDGWEKICNAVDVTNGQLLYYNGELVQYALFHASSGGSTENCEDVFVSAVPYLRSVESPYEDGHSRSGHGVGMSQYGANGMAQQGFTYKEILSHYYSGTEVK